MIYDLLIGDTPYFNKCYVNEKFENGQLTYCFDPIDLSMYRLNYKNKRLDSCVKYDIVNDVKTTYYYKYVPSQIQIYIDDLLIYSYEILNHKFISYHDFKNNKTWFFQYEDDKIICKNENETKYEMYISSSKIILNYISLLYEYIFIDNQLDTIFVNDNIEYKLNYNNDNNDKCDENDICNGRNKCNVFNKLNQIVYSDNDTVKRFKFQYVDKYNIVLKIEEFNMCKTIVKNIDIKNI